MDFRKEQYTQDDVDSEAPQQAPEEIPEEIPKQSGAPTDDCIDIPLSEEEITILTSGEEEGGTQEEEKEDQPRDQAGPVKVISIDLNEENAPVACKWGSFSSLQPHIYLLTYLLNTVSFFQLLPKPWRIVQKRSGV